MLLVESGLMAHEAVLEFAYCVDWLTGRYGTRPTIQAPAIVGEWRRGGKRDSSSRRRRKSSKRRGTTS